MSSEGRAVGPIVAVLASAGRPELLGSVVRNLRDQTRPPDRIVLSVPDDRSLPAEGIDGCEIVRRTGGLAAQRNAGMDAAPDAAFYFFFDDDSIVHPAYVERALTHFREVPEMVGLTGAVLLDGASSEAIGHDAAATALAMADKASGDRSRTAVRGLYGCNFAVRRLPDMTRFDDRLPLYSWLEDRDFSHRLGRRGRTVRVSDCMIVHIGAPSGGRVAHVRLGYTQVMNPAYMWTKRSFTFREAFWEIGKRVAKNLAGSLIGSSRHWRRRRLRGNCIACLSLMRGEIAPERMTEFG